MAGEEQGGDHIERDSVFLRTRPQPAVALRAHSPSHGRAVPSPALTATSRPCDEGCRSDLCQYFVASVLGLPRWRWVTAGLPRRPGGGGTNMSRRGAATSVRVQCGSPGKSDSRVECPRPWSCRADSSPTFLPIPRAERRLGMPFTCRPGPSHVAPITLSERGQRFYSESICTNKTMSCHGEGGTPAQDGRGLVAKAALQRNAATHMII